MDIETEPETSAQLKAMGFASFGQQHKRPKHHHHHRKASSDQSVHNSLPKKPTPPTQPLPEAGHIPASGHGGEQPHPDGRPSSSSVQDQMFSGQSRQSSNSSGPRHPYYSRSFVDNPWEALEKKMGIFVVKSN